MIRGSCFCGGIQFETEKIPLLTNCHCSKCRKSRGAAFNTTASVPLSTFRFVKGNDLIQTYQPKAGGYSTTFCRVCGSTAPMVIEDGDLVLFPAGLLDDDPAVKPALHMFVGSKAPWWDITDNAPQFDEWVPGYGPDA
jgi:hypothetical protein